MIKRPLSLIIRYLILNCAVLLPEFAVYADVSGDWPKYGLDNKEQRFSPLAKINTENVSELGLAWYFETDYNRGHEATPIVIDGVMYFTSNWSLVYAVNAVTGELLWKYDPKVPKEWGKMACCDVVNRGVAVSDGKVIVGTLDTRLVALDQNTGDVIWETKTADTDKWPYTITGAPRVAKGKVFIGNGGAEYGVRGYVSAYDLETGDLAWRFYTVPGNPADGFESSAMQKAAQTWTGEWWEFGGGGTVWDSIVYDEELDQLYIGVGNGSPWNQRIRSPEGGDNLFLSSIVALDPDTGEYIWHYQSTPAESWDYTATQHIMLADMEWQGEQRKVLWQAPKNGFFFIVDRTNGKLLSAENFARVNWAEGYDLDTGRPIVTENADYSKEAKFIIPSPVGAHNWHPMAHHPDTGYVYIPVVDAGATYKEIATDSYEFGQWHPGVDLAEPLPKSAELVRMLHEKVPKGYLVAWDPNTQSAAWRVQRKIALNSGLLATAGGLVFQGTGDARLTAVRASTGEELWSYDTKVGVVAPPVTFSVDGEQYLSVLVGWGGIAGLAYGRIDQANPAPNGKLMTFKLGANGLLPPLPYEVETYPLPERPDVDSAVLAQGDHLYHNYCSVCHGVALIANKAVPDLRNLPMVFYDNWDGVVRDGMMQKAGMVGFGEVLTQEETDAIYAYVIDAAYRQREESEDTAWNSVKRFFYRGVTWAADVMDGFK